MNRIFRETAKNLQAMIPKDSRVESYRDKNLNAWRDWGAYQPIASSSQNIEVKVNQYEFGEIIFAEIQHLLNHVAEQRAHIISALHGNCPSPSWLFVSAYYAALYATLAWTRSMNLAVLYLDKPAIHQFSFGATQSPTAGAFTATLVQSSNSAEHHFRISKSKKSHFHEAVWLTMSSTASTLLLQIQQEISSRQATSDELDSIRLLKLFDGFSFEEPHYWPSLLRNAINYRPGYSYRSIPKNNFLALDFVKKPLGPDRIESALAEAEKLKIELKGTRSPTEMPNEAALLLMLQASLIDLCVTKGIESLCKQNGFRNTPFEERKRFAKNSIANVNSVSRGLAF